MARDRKRSKQRQRQRRASGADAARERDEPIGAPEPTDDASGDAEIAELALEGLQEPGAPVDRPLEPDEFPQPDETEADTPPAQRPRSRRAARRAARGEGGEGGDGGEPPELGDDIAAIGEPDEPEPVAVGALAGVPGAEAPKSGNRFANFLRASAAELRRVQWPNRQQVGQATAVVVGFIIVAGTYLFLADAVFSRFVKAIL